MHLLDILIALAVGAIAGILIGRRTSLDRLRTQELEAELGQVRQGASRYREDVASHFEKTSELIKGLTIQYRAMYDHLSDGARELCPERMIELSQSDSRQALLGGGAPPTPDAYTPPAPDAYVDAEPETEAELEAEAEAESESAAAASPAAPPARTTH